MSESFEDSSEEMNMDKLKEVIDVETESVMDISESDSDIVKGWVRWCRSHSYVKCVETDVPSGILPNGYSGVLIDVKVGGNKRAPDDKIYLANKLLREKVARGNCVLELNKIERGRIIATKYIFIVFALKKFSGGMGDEDDSPLSSSQWEHYFIKPMSSAKTLIATEKANGEAGHVSALKLFGKTYFCFGSKNVHMLVKGKDDIIQYSESRFDFARRVARCFYNTYLENPAISQEKKQSLISFLQRNKYTAVTEMIQPENQHIVNLSYLANPELKFICWTKPDLEESFSGKDSYCAIPVNECIEQARKFGLNTIDYENVTFGDGELETITEEYMEKIRNGNGYEGKVLYFLDEDNHTIGLIKKKTAWYILLRALRQKLDLFTNSKRKAYSTSEKHEMIKKRFKDIREWLGFSKNYTDSWTELAIACVNWVSKSKSSNNVRSDFPVMFDHFLQSSHTDKALYDKLLKCTDMKNY